MNLPHKSYKRPQLLNRMNVIAASYKYGHFMVSLGDA